MVRRLIESVLIILFLSFLMSAESIVNLIIVNLGL